MINKIIYSFQLLCVLVLLITFASKSLQSQTWEPRDMGHTGNIDEIVKYKDKLYTYTTEEGDLYYSNLDGDEWNEIEIPNMKQPFIEYLISDDEYLYAAMSSAEGFSIYRTDFQDNNWEKIYALPLSLSKQNAIRIVESNSVLFLYYNALLYSSSDFGDTWKKIATPNISSIDAIRVIENNLYLIANGVSTFFASNDLGKTWKDPIFFTEEQLYTWNELKNSLYMTFYIFQNNNYIFYTTIYNSELNKFVELEQPLFDGLPLYATQEVDSQVAALTIQVVNNSSAFNWQAFYSNDKGDTWKKVFDTVVTNILIRNYKLFLSNNKIMLPTQYEGLLYIDLDKDSYYLMKDNFHSDYINDLFIEDNKFIISSWNSGIYYSYDYGRNFELSKTTPKNSTNNINIVFNVIKYKGSYLASTNDGIYKSTDNGANWQLFANVPSLNIYADNSKLYSAYGDGTFRYSTDGEQTWTNTTLPDNALPKVYIVDNDIICIQTDKGMYRSSDLGVSWAKTATMQEEWGRAPIKLTKSGNNYVLSTGKTVYISEDKGLNWHISQQQPATNFGMITKFKSLGNLLFASASRGLYLSLEYGNNFKKVSDDNFDKGLLCASILNDSIYVVPYGDVIYKANIADFSDITISSIPQNTFCAGSIFEVPYTIKSNLYLSGNNKFTVQLSNNQGSFYENTTNIGEIVAQTGGTIIATIPDTVKYSSKYRIRIIASERNIIGIDNLHDITILATNPIQITGKNEVCSNKEYEYSVNTASGYQYHWEINGGVIINDPNSVKVKAKWDNVGIGTISLIQMSEGGCSDTAKFSVNITETAPKPIITQLDNNTLESSNDFGNQWYFNGQKLENDTNKVLSVNNDGNYTVHSQNSLGCESEMSDIFGYINEDNKLVLRMDTLSANSGDIIAINIRLKKNDAFYSLNATKFEATLKFNSTILFPETADKGGVVANQRFMTVTFDTNYTADDIIYTFDCTAMLGEVESTPITITNLKIDGNNYDNYIGKDGLFSLNDICYEGGARLITSNQTSSIISISPNPTSDNINTQISIGEKSNIKLYIQNTLGIVVKEIINTSNEAGQYNYTANTNDLPVGEYNIILETNLEKIAKKFIIIR